MKKVFTGEVELQAILELITYRCTTTGAGDFLLKRGAMPKSKKRGGHMKKMTIILVPTKRRGVEAIKIVMEFEDTPKNT